MLSHARFVTDLLQTANLSRQHRKRIRYGRASTGDVFEKVDSALVFDVKTKPAIIEYELRQLATDRDEDPAPAPASRA